MKSNINQNRIDHNFHHYHSGGDVVVVVVIVDNVVEWLLMVLDDV